MQPEHQILSSPQLPQCNCDLRRSVLRTFCKYSRERDSRGLPQRLSTIRPDTTSDPAKPSTTSTSCKYSNGRWYRQKSRFKRRFKWSLDRYKPTKKKILSRKTYQRQPHNRPTDRSICSQHGVDPSEIDPNPLGSKNAASTMVTCRSHVAARSTCHHGARRFILLRPASCCFDRWRSAGDLYTNTCGCPHLHFIITLCLLQQQGGDRADRGM